MSLQQPLSLCRDEAFGIRQQCPMLPAPHYLLVLKANHSKAFLAVQECCERHCFARGATARPVFDAFDDSHGRLVRRRVFVCP